MADEHTMRMDNAVEDVMRKLKEYSGERRAGYREGVTDIMRFYEPISSILSETMKKLDADFDPDSKTPKKSD